MGDHENDLTSAEFLELTHIEGTSSSSDGTGRIGHYRILQKLGEGGMGVVYEAEQEHPVRRKVALKVIKLGMDTAQVVARFQSERQALALMNHPNIARVYDGGATEQGRPFFSMEFVAGVPISEYCNRNRLGTRERLEIFIQVCEGVQHAHQKGIIHRDIKPSNVLVQDQDGHRVPKIIDFGVAKATAQRLTEQTFFTKMGQLIGTPEYMSPEQAEMSGMDIDTRTDVYLLGVLLYELLTGELPFTSETLRNVGFNEFRRKVLEEEPPKPSTRVTTYSRTGATSPPPPPPILIEGLARQLRGDLDWITMKALEKDRTRRYASASELSNDLRRHLNHEPVLACPPSNLYTLSKFVRRNKAGVAAGGLVLMGLVLGAVATSWGLVQAKRANRIAKIQTGVAQQERDRAERQRQRADGEAARAGQVSDFLVELFDAADPDTNMGETITAREILERGARRVEDELAETPRVQARLMHTIANAYLNLGFRELAEPLLSTALTIQLDVLDDEDLEVATTMNTLAGTLINTGEFARAQRFYQRALDIRRDKLPASHPLVLESKANLGSLLGTRGEYDQAIQFWEEVLEVRMRETGPTDPKLAPTIGNLGVMEFRRGEFDKAADRFEQSLALVRAKNDLPWVARFLTRLGRTSLAQKNYPEARGRLEEARDVRIEIYGGDHPDYAKSLLWLAILSQYEGDREGAARLHQQAVEIIGRRNIDASPFLLHIDACYATLDGRQEQALDYLWRSVVDHGYTGLPIDSDPCLVSLREHKTFRRILDHMQQRTGNTNR